ncbi:MAG TPA: exosortase F system-associated protein [Aequorivita sp.]|nr:exosortase F system-associated protein [Aequorivita sp.]
MKNVFILLIVGCLFILLILIRAFEEALFYDPLLHYFKADYKNLPLPSMDLFKLQLGVVFRFMLNTIISLGILWFVFKDREIVKLSLVLYGVLFLVLFATFSFIIYTSGEGTDQFLLFYVRRFLIQPIFILILLPAFYFQKYKFK